MNLKKKYIFISDKILVEILILQRRAPKKILKSLVFSYSLSSQQLNSTPLKIPDCAHLKQNKTFRE